MHPGGPGLRFATTRVPHLRDSLIVAKEGYRATREPLHPKYGRRLPQAMTSPKP